MAEVVLTNGMIAYIDDEDHPKIQGYRWRLYDSCGRRYVHADAHIGGRDTTVRLHKVILGLPRGKACFHKDGDPLNNRKSNLKVKASSLKSVPSYARWLMYKEALEEERHTQL